MERGGSGRSRIRPALAAIVAAAMLLILALAVWRGCAAAGIDVTALRSQDVESVVRGWGRWGWVASIGLMVLHSFLPLPAEIIALANGMLFGPVIGSALTWGGAMLGALLSFALARACGRPFLRLVLTEDQRRRLDRFDPGTGALLLARLVPVLSFNLVNYAAGLLGVPWWRFLWTTALGILPLTLVMVLMGGAMLRAPLWAWSGVALAAIALWLLWKARRQAPP